MSSSKAKGQGDEMFLRAAWDTIVDAEKSFGLYVTVEMKVTRRIGVVQVVMAARRPLAHATDPSPIRVVGEFPNATAGTFAAFMYSQAVKTYHCMEAWHVDAVNEDMRQSGGW